MSTVVSGVGDWALSVMVREPVTVMTPISSSSDFVSAVCAQTVIAAKCSRDAQRNHGRAEKCS